MEPLTSLVFGPIGLPVFAAAVPEMFPSSAGLSGWELGMLAVGAFALGMVYGSGPGHPRLMMRGLPGATSMAPRQSQVFGLSGALSHSAVIFAFATAAAHIGARLHTAAPRSVLHAVVGIAIGAVAAWTYLGTQRETSQADVAGGTFELPDGHGSNSMEKSAAEDSESGYLSTESPAGSESLKALAGRGILGGLPMASSAAVAIILLFLLSEDRARGVAFAAAFVAGFTAVSSALTDRLARGIRRERATNGHRVRHTSLAWSAVLACLSIYVVFESWTHSRPTFYP